MLLSLVACGHKNHLYTIAALLGESGLSVVT